MKEEVIIEAAKKYEKSTEFDDIVFRAKGVNSAAGIGFLEGAVWMQEQMIDKTREWLENIYAQMVQSYLKTLKYRKAMEDKK